MAKKVLVIDAGVHQGMAQGQLNHHLAQLAKETLASLGFEVEIVRVEDDYDLGEQAQRLIAADYIIVQTPAFWMTIPWQLKKYMDTVMVQPGVGNGDGRHRDNPEAKYGTGGLHKDKRVLFSMTWNAPAEAFSDPKQFFEGKGIDAVLYPIIKAFEFVGIPHLPTFMANDVIKNPDHEGDDARFVEHLKTYIK